MDEDRLDAEFDSDASVHTVQSEQTVLQRLTDLPQKKFLKGIAISMWQNSGDADSNWTRFVNGHRCCGMRSTIADGTTDTFPDTWNRYKEDVALLKEMNCNAFRLSLEWARIEPEQGVYDADAIARYNEIFDCLEENGMTPFVTLHHFVHPGWFEDRGGFEKEENIEFFVKYAIEVFKLFSRRTPYWGTINEPSVYTFCAYIGGMHPPGVSHGFKLAGVVLLNMLKSHCQIYEALKALDKDNDCMIGIVQHNIWFVPSGRSMFYTVCKYLYLRCHPEFLSNGEVQMVMPLDSVYSDELSSRKAPLYFTGVEYTYPHGRPPCDWWGINYYSRVKAGWTLQPLGGQEIITDMGYPIYPKGLYRAIKAGNALGIPIYITETGVADDLDDRRHIMIKGYTNELIRAIKHGFDVRGIFYWTLVDNFEWNLGYKPRFGLYEFNPDKGMRCNFSEQVCLLGVDRKLRSNSKKLQEIYKAWPDRLDEMYRYAKDGDIPSFRTVAAEYKTKAA